jgi:hypothetical protein
VTEIYGAIGREMLEAKERGAPWPKAPFYTKTLGDEELSVYDESAASSFGLPRKDWTVVAVLRRARRGVQVGRYQAALVSVHLLETEPALAVRMVLEEARRAMEMRGDGPTV